MRTRERLRELENAVKILATDTGHTVAIDEWGTPHVISQKFSGTTTNEAIRAICHHLGIKIVQRRGIEVLPIGAEKQ